VKNLRTLFVAVFALLISSVSPAFAGWVANYGGGTSASPYAIAVGTDGSTYVAGTRTTSGQLDVMLLKYNTSGSLVWAKTYANSVGGDDYPASLAVYNDGTNDYIYVGATSNYGGSRLNDLTTLKYDASGALQWVKVYNGGSSNIARGMKVDSSGNVYVIADTVRHFQDIGLFKYDANGTFQWAYVYNGSASIFDYVRGVAIDSNGDVIITGGANRTTLDYVTIKVSSAGVPQWARAYDSGGYDLALGVATQGTDIVVTGLSADNAVTCKYNSSGVLQWVSTYDNGSSDSGSLITTAADGTVYVAGTSIGTGTEIDWFTTKYNSAGVAQWTKRTRTRYYDYPNALVVDSSYNVYVGGYVQGTTSGDDNTWQDAFTVKYDSSGTPTFSARYTGAYGDDTVNALTVSGGNIYVAINATTNWGARKNIVTIKY
jgi:hypothetical protein